jgi:serine/threonine protein kinase
MTSKPAKNPDALDELVLACLERYDEVGTAAIDEVCDAHPGSAGALRRRMTRLLATGLVADAEEEAFPERLGEFRLLRRLGGGGMGVVYLAEQESLGREVALKLIRPDQLYFPGARERFRREVELVARLEHPGIVPVYTFGEENGIPYFAMQRVVGCTLAEVLRELGDRDPRRLAGADLAAALGACLARAGVAVGVVEGPPFRGSWSDACLALGRSVAQALEHAHGLGVQHRDVKPSNVLLTPDGRALLFDFGLSSGDGVSAITRTGAQLGSLPYMAPEQFGAGRGAPDARTDVYQVGATLTELLTLRRPFAGVGATEAIQAIRRGALPRVSAATTGAPPDAAVVVAKATAVAVEDRYATAGALARDLDRVLARLPIEAQRAGPLLRLVRALQRKPERALTAGLVVLLLLFGAVGFATQQRLANRATGAALADAEREGRRAEANLDTALSAVVSMAEVNHEKLADVPGLSAERLVWLERSLALFGELMGQRPGDVELELQHARIRRETANALATLGLPGRADEAFAEAEAVFRRYREQPDDAPSDTPGARDLRWDLGLLLAGRVETLRELHRPEEELAAAQEAVALLDALASRADAPPREILALKAAQSKLAWTLRLQARLDESLAAFEQAIATARRLVAVEGRAPRALGHEGDALTEAALVRYELGRVDEAEQGALEGLDLLRESVRRDPAWTLGRVFLVQALSMHCIRLGELMRFAEAAELGEEGVELADKLVRDFPARMDLQTHRLNLLSNLGFTWVLLGEREKALPALRSVAAARAEQTARSPDSHEQRLLLALSLNNLATLAQELERWDEACDAADEAVRLFGEHRDANPDDRDAAAQLGFASIVQGEAHAGRCEYPDLDALAAETRRLCPNDAAATCMLGILAARCYDAARRDPGLAAPEREARAAEYQARALASLEQSFREGFDGFWMLDEAVELESLRAQPEYAELLARYRQ